MTMRDIELLRVYVRRYIVEERRRNQQFTLLKEYVRSILAEDEAGGNVAMGAGGDTVPGMVGPYGVSFGSKSDLINTFITPFLDVANTAIGKYQEIGEKAKSLVLTALGTVVSTFVPGLAFNYKKIFENEKKNIDELRKTYGEVYKRTDEALASKDAAALAFMAYPGQVLGALVGKKSPEVALGLMSAASFGAADKAIEFAKAGGSALDDWLTGGSERGGKRSKGKRGSNESFRRRMRASSRLLREQDEKEVLEKLSEPNVMEKIFSSSESKRMQQKAREIYRSTLEDVMEKADEVFNKTNNFNDVKRYISKMKSVSPDKKKSLDDVEELEGEEKEKAAKVLIDNLQDSFKEFYVKNLTDHMEGVIKAGVPEDTQYVKDYKTVIQKIKSMK